MYLYLDFETRSVLDLREVGLHNYARHPSTEAWCLAYAVDDSKVFSVAPHEFWQFGSSLQTYFKISDTIVVAHNAAFELEIWNEIMVPRAGWPPLNPAQVVCTMAASYAMGLPGSLEGAAMAMGLDVRKDMEGRALVLRMARPRSIATDGTPNWWADPERIESGTAYCVQDVVVTRALHKRLVPLGQHERTVYLADYDINHRGIQLDVDTARAATELIEQLKVEADLRCSIITDNRVTSINALGAMKEWLLEQNPKLNFASLAKQDVVTLLARPVLTDAARAVLILRQEIGKASVAKLNKMLALAGEDGRMRNTTQYHGAAPGRWAGRGIQPHNMPRAMPKPEDVEKIMALMRAGNAGAIDMLYGPPISVISSCLRSFLTCAPGNKLVSGDFANVEGRGVAWFSGEEWKLDAFRRADRGEGAGVYEIAAAHIFGCKPEDIKDPSEQRQIGKVAELSLGYQGGKGAFQRMAPTYGVYVEDDVAEDIKIKWRFRHPRTVATWAQLDNAAKLAIANPGKIFAAGAPGRQAKFKVAGSFLWCLLPSGRPLCYPYPKIVDGKFGDMVSFMSVPAPEKWGAYSYAKANGLLYIGEIVDDPTNTSSWARHGIYGGKWMENIVQAFCRDLLVDKVILPFAEHLVLHVHDEGVLEVPAAMAAQWREALEYGMNTAPEWAEGFPLFAKVKIMERYGK